MTKSTVKQSLVAICLAMLTVAAFAHNVAAQADFGMLTLGVVAHGSLQAGAFALDESTFVDLYLYEASHAEEVRVVVRSDAFQPYVFITDITGLFLTGDDDPDSGGWTTLTFYPDGTAERHSVHAVSIPGFGSSQSTEYTAASYAVLGNIMFLFSNTNDGIDAEMLVLQLTSNELYLDDTYYRRVD